MPKIIQKQALRLLGIENQKLQKLIDQGELEYERKGHFKYFEQSEVFRVAKKLAQEYKERMN